MCPSPCDTRGSECPRRRWAGCVPESGAPGGRCGDAEEVAGGVAWASGGPALASAESGVIFSSAHPPPLPLSPLPPARPPSLPCSGENSWNCSDVPGRPVAASDSASHREWGMWWAWGERSVTASVQLVAEAGIWWIFPYLHNPSPVCCLCCQMSLWVQIPLCVLERGGAWQPVGDYCAQLSCAHDRTLLHRCPGHFSLFGFLKLLGKIEDSEFRQGPHMWR